LANMKDTKTSYQ